MFLVKALTNIKTIVAKNKFLTVLFLLALFLRLYELEKFTIFLSDQGRDAIIIKRIVTLQDFPFIGPTTSIGGIFMGPFYYYLMAPFLLFANFNPLGLSVGMALLSLLGIVISYLFVKQEINKNTAVLFVVLIIFSSVQIDFARFSWNPNLLPIFAFFTLFCLYKLMKKPHTIFAVGVGAFLSLSIQLHYLAMFLFAPIGLFFLEHFFKTKNKLQYIRYVGISILSFIIFYSPLILFDLRHQFLNSRNFLKLFQHSEFVSNSSYWNRFLETVGAFVNHIAKTNVTNDIALFAFVTFIIGVILSYRHKHSDFIKLHMYNFIAYIVIFSFLTSARHPHYYATVYFSFFLLAAYVLYICSKTPVLRYGALILIIVYCIANARYYEFLKPQKDDWNQLKHSQRVGDFLAEKIYNKPFNVATWPIAFGEENYLYFTELKGNIPADRAKGEVTEQMFVLCGKEPCEVINSPSWNISMFGKAKIDQQWEIDGVKIYKLVHEK